MAQGPSDTILVAIRITLRIRESKVRNRDPPDRRRFVLSECIFYLWGNAFLAIFFDRVSTEGNAIAFVRSSVCLSVRPSISTLTFEPTNL